MVFIDTNMLLDDFNYPKERFYISSVSLEELEAIKTSANKDADTKYQARRALHFLSEHPQQFEVVVWREKDAKTLKKLDLPENNDSKIIVCALKAQKTDKNLVFATKDLACRTIASLIAGLNTSYKLDVEEEYTGFKTVKFETEEGLANFYSKMYDDKTYNPFNLLVNEYLIITDADDNVIDKYKWCGPEEGMVKVKYRVLDTVLFSKIKPMDEYQECVLDSLATNQITAIRGPAGSGKSLLGLAHLIDLRERGKIDKIIIFTNTVATKGSAKLGLI